MTGGELALALASSVGGERHLPSVVTLASCDSAAQGSLTTPGGSVAHDLHAVGHPARGRLTVPDQRAGVDPVHGDVLRRSAVRRAPAGVDHRHAASTRHRVQRRARMGERRRLRGAARRASNDGWTSCSTGQARRGYDIALGRLERLATSDIERMAQRAESRPSVPRRVRLAGTASEHEALVEAVVRGRRTRFRRRARSPPNAKGCAPRRRSARPRWPTG